MPERKFEFIVYQPLEVCEKRFKEMRDAGEKFGISNPISIEITQNEKYSQAVLYQDWGSRVGKLKAVATIKPIDATSCLVSGKAVAKNNAVWLVFVAIAVTPFLFVIMQEQIWRVAIFIALWLLVVSLQFNNGLNQFVDTLEASLTQPKKKKD